MTLPTLPRDEWEIALVVCTDKQLEALELYRLGYGYRRIARALGVSTGTARDRVEGAVLKIRNVKKENAI